MEYSKHSNEAKEKEYNLIKSGKKKHSDPKTWRPINYIAKMPEKSVKLNEGLIKQLFENNIKHILECYQMPDYCTGAPAYAQSGHGWSHWLPASNDARILGGAANSLMWTEHRELRNIVDTIVSKIAVQMRDDGYYNYYSEKESFGCVDNVEVNNSLFQIDEINSERKNYDRVFWTRGMISAWKCGNRDALPLLRRMYDWFNSAYTYLPYLLCGGNATNGFPGGPLMYHTDLGKPEDIFTNQCWYDQDFWMNDLEARKPESFSLYPGNRPHCYDLLELEALADEYRATGESHYLKSLIGAWDVYYSGYKHIGGATAICEAGGPYPYQSYYITTGHNGETCGSVFWIWVNSRLMQLFPSEEKYANEIEEAIFNVILASRTDNGNTRYHNRMQGIKDIAKNENSCCEVSSSLLVSELPKYIFLKNEEEIWINLFIPSEFSLNETTLKMNTDFPYDNKVSISFSGKSCEKTIHIRVPSWAKKPINYTINGNCKCIGAPGSYIALKRLWNDADTICFSLPMEFSVKKYTGADIAPNGKNRYALLYGPILMALTGNFNADDIPEIQYKSNEVPLKLIKADNKLTFQMKYKTPLLYKPYFSINQEIFNCFPTME